MVQCPHCRHEMQIKGAKVGQLYPTCPRCATRFTVLIDQEGAEPMVVPETVQAQAARNGRSTATIAPEPLDVAPPAPPAVPAPEPRAASPSSRPTIRPETKASPKTDPDNAFTLRDNTPKLYQQSTGRVPVTQRTTHTGTLGGYELKRKLGQGGMGTVYLARQVSLDRNVAVKVLNDDLSKDVQFVSRFVREAFAAAQLVHHNVVQIHDIGEDQSSHFFSMEYVKGRSLAEVIRTEGAIAPDTAAGYILQAARGLKLAHDQGMVHRDIKPENLLLSEDGIVKVADLGLVKRAGDGPEPVKSRVRPVNPDVAEFEATLAQSTMGTPAYMAPEQAADAASVDARADIYSLGCTLFALLTGRPPFEGKNAESIIRQASLGEVPTPLKYNPHIPSELGRICRKMTAKKREGRYPNINLVIRDLENYLGVDPAGAFTPRQQHVQELERCVKAYHDNNLATIQKVLYAGSGFFSLVVVASLCWGGRWWLAAAGLALVLCTFLFYQLMVEFSGQRHLIRRARLAMQMLTWSQWAQAGVAGLLLVLAIIAMGIVLPTLGIVAVSLIVALLARSTLDRMVTRRRHGSFAQAEAMLRSFRVQGMDEEAIRRFVCEYSGHYWEEFYEEMFGYDAKIEARKRWGRTIRGHQRPRFAPWRDPIVQWIDRRIEAQQQEKQRRFLLNAQIKALRAQGMDEISAGKEAKRMTEIMLSQAAGLREDARKYREDPAATIPADPAKQQLVPKPREAFNFDVEVDRVTFKNSGYLERRYGGPLDWILGPRLRFALAAVLLIGFLTWQATNRGVAENQARQILGERIDPTLQDPTLAMATQHTMEQQAVVYRPLSETMSWLPETYTNAAGSWNGGAAGAILLISSFVPGTVVAIPIYIAVVVMLFGHETPLAKIPIGEPTTVSLLMGLSLAMLTFLFSRKQA